MTDIINKPPHYTKGKIECIEAIDAALGDHATSYYKGNVIKYLWRADYKGGLDDLKKAKWYLDRAVALEELIQDRILAAKEMKAMQENNPED